MLLFDSPAEFRPSRRCMHARWWTREGRSRGVHRVAEASAASPPSLGRPHTVHHMHLGGWHLAAIHPCCTSTAPLQAPPHRQGSPGLHRLGRRQRHVPALQQREPNRPPSILSLLPRPHVLRRRRVTGGEARRGGCKGGGSKWGAVVARTTGRQVSGWRPHGAAIAQPDQCTLLLLLLLLLVLLFLLLLLLLLLLFLLLLFLLLLLLLLLLVLLLLLLLLLLLRLTGRPLPMMISSTHATCSRLVASYWGVVTHLRRGGGGGIHNESMRSPGCQ